MAAAAIVDFKIFKFLTVGTVKSVELRNRTKFRRNRSNRGRDIVIFRFFKMAAAAILDFRNFKFLTVETVKKVELRQHAKFRWNRLNRGRDIVIYRLFKMAAAAILNFRVTNYVTVPNFVEIARNAAEICKFYYYAIFT